MLKGSDKLQIYPRGFLGTPIADLIAPKATPFSDRYKEKQFNWTLTDTRDKKRIADKQVDQLFAKLIRAERSVDLHAFRQEVFKCAFRLMGSRDFYFWFQAQSASPLFGPYHRDFLEDTINYLSTGKRLMPVHTWDMLISHSVDDAVEFKMSQQVKDFFGLPYPGSGIVVPKNRSTAVVLQSWWSHPDGMSDLLYSLHILFGQLQT